MWVLCIFVLETAAWVGSTGNATFLTLDDAPASVSWRGVPAASSHTCGCRLLEPSRGKCGTSTSNLLVSITLRSFLFSYLLVHSQGSCSCQATNRYSRCPATQQLIICFIWQTKIVKSVNFITLCLLLPNAAYNSTTVVRFKGILHNLSEVQG